MCDWTTLVTSACRAIQRNCTTADQLYFLLFLLLLIGDFFFSTNGLFLYLKHLSQQFWWFDWCVHAVLGSLSPQSIMSAQQRLLSRGSPSLWFIFLFFPFLSFFLSFFLFFFLQLASHRSVIISVRSVEQKSRIKYILIRVWSFYLWVCDSDRKKNKESVFNSGQNKE